MVALAVRKKPLVVGNGSWECVVLGSSWKSSSAGCADKMEFCKFESRVKKKQYFCSLLFGFVFGAIF